MILTEKHVIKKSNKKFKELDDLCFLSKNLYNSALYSIRQSYFETKEYTNYYAVVSKFTKENQIDYRSLPSKVSQQTLKVADQNFKSFFACLKSKNVEKAKIPKYLEKNGRFVVTYTNQAISKKMLKEGVIKLSGSSVEIKTKVKNVRQVRIVPRKEYVVVEVLYETTDVEKLSDNGRYCSIDLGINNLATVGSNVIKPIIINGRPIKSINQYYNKMLSKGKKRNVKRNFKVDDYLHKASKYLVNHLVSNDIPILVIGYNKGWKQDINIGKVNNQKFVQIPHSKFIDMIKYKCDKVRINVIITEESYTSKCSFKDSEDLKFHENYLGKRVKRGLFENSDGSLINADLNGALNILRKVVGDFDYDPIEVCSTPLVITIKQN